MRNKCEYVIYFYDFLEKIPLMIMICQKKRTKIKNDKNFLLYNIKKIASPFLHNFVDFFLIFLLQTKNYQINVEIWQQGT